MNLQGNRWEVPFALGMIFCSLMPVSLLYFIDSIDYRSSDWAYKHKVLPYIAWTFQSFHSVGFVLPFLTMITAVWFLTGKFVTTTRLAWIILLLTILHGLWLSWGILAFYLANQTFIMY